MRRRLRRSRRARNGRRRDRCCRSHVPSTGSTRLSPVHRRGRAAPRSPSRVRRAARHERAGSTGGCPDGSTRQGQDVRTCQRTERWRGTRRPCRRAREPRAVPMSTPALRAPASHVESDHRSTRASTRSRGREAPRGSRRSRTQTPVTPAPREPGRPRPNGARAPPHQQRSAPALGSRPRMRLARSGRRRRVETSSCDRGSVASPQTIPDRCRVDTMRFDALPCTRVMGRSGAPR